MRQLSIIGLLLIFLLPRMVQAGEGTIREGIVNDLSAVSSFNPLRCDDSVCAWAVERIFPTLLAYDPESRWFGSGTSENGGLATSWDISADNMVYTFHLREDAFWTDGSPITAYDYFYSYLAIMSEDFSSPYFESLRTSIEGVVPLSDKELVLIFKANNCELLQNVNFPIAPAHVFAAEFAGEATDFFDETDPREQWAAWSSNPQADFRFMNETPFDANPSVTGGVFDFVGYQPYAYIRLQKGDLSYELLPVSSRDEAVNLFLNDELTLIQNPPLNRWADMSAAEDVQLYQSPSLRWDYIAFNLEEPFEPNSAFDEDRNPLVQEPNPYFADIRVRQAIQLAINVPELIEVGLQGQGSQLAAIFSPASWAYDASLSPYPYDPEAARDLLDAAGWIQEGNNRICVDCLHTDYGRSLSIDLAYGDFPHQRRVAELIAQQLYQVGISVNVSSGDFGRVQRQGFDLYLGTWGDEIPLRGLDELFTPENDIVGRGWNFGSYNNPNLSNLLQEAQTVAGCGLDARISAYHAAQTLLQADLPYVWLYAQDERLAVRGNVQNFAPTVGQPLGNLLDWRVFDVPRG